jgi:membrane associated rhomboid family serine protease/Zn-finger nucleic acid-binding protein
MRSRCPRDGSRLERARHEEGLRWSCSRCGGMALGLPIMRKHLAPEVLSDLWQRARAGQGSASRACPDCARAMRELPAPCGSTLELDVCTTCHLLWLDPGELESLPAPAAPRELSHEARRAVALVQVQALRDASLTDELRESQTWYEVCLALLGLPVEHPEREPAGTAWATRALVLAVALLGGAALLDLDRWVAELALIPAQPWRHSGLTLLTSFVLHGDALHLAGNLYFWWIFGDDVEDSLGWPRYLLLLIGASLVGDLLHVALDPQRDVPVIGASGAISGVLIFYALRFPGARISIPHWIFLHKHVWIRYGMPFWLTLWIAAQGIGALQQLGGLSAVSALSHLGGALVGLTFWLLARGETIQPG